MALVDSSNLPARITCAAHELHENCMCTCLHFGRNSRGALPGNATRLQALIPILLLISAHEMLAFHTGTSFPMPLQVSRRKNGMAGSSLPHFPFQLIISIFPIAYLRVRCH